MHQPERWCKVYCKDGGCITLEWEFYAPLVWALRNYVTSKQDAVFEARMVNGDVCAILLSEVTCILSSSIDGMDRMAAFEKMVEEKRKEFTDEDPW